MSFTLKTTTSGQTKIASAIQSGVALTISHLAVGSTDGALLTAASLALGSEEWRGKIVDVVVAESKVTFRAVIPGDIGGFTIRELGLFDIDGALIAYANFPDLQKPNIADGSAVNLTINASLEVANGAVQVLINPAQTTAWADMSNVPPQTLRDRIELEIDLAQKADLDLSNVLPGSVKLAALAAEILALFGTGFSPSQGQGDWLPATNTPALPAPGTAGNWFRVAADGTAAGTNFDGDFLENDTVVDTGAAWRLLRLPTINVPDDFILLEKLAEDVRRRFDDEVRPDVAWRVPDINGRTPLWLSWLGKLYADLADNTIEARHIADDAVEARHLADGSVGSEQLANGAVGSDQLAEESIEFDHLAPEAVGSLLALLTSSTASSEAKVLRSVSIPIVLDRDSTIAWSTLPDIPIEGSVYFTNTDNVDVVVGSGPHSRTALIRLRSQKQPLCTGLIDAAPWDPNDPLPDNDHVGYNIAEGLGFHISATANGYTQGNRLVYHCIDTHTNNVNPSGDLRLWLELDPLDGQVWRGEWDATGAYPANPNQEDGDRWMVSVGGTKDYVTYAKGDTLIRDSGSATGYRLEPGNKITNIAASGLSTEVAGIQSLGDLEAIIDPAGPTTGRELYLTAQFNRAEVVRAYEFTNAGKLNIALVDADGGVHALSDINGAYNNRSPRFDGTRLIFESDRGGSYARYMVKLDQRDMLPIDGIVTPLFSRDVVAFGDSMMYQSFGRLKTAIEAFDAGNATAARNYVNHNFGSLNASQIMRQAWYYAGISGSANMEADRLAIVYVDQYDANYTDNQKNIVARAAWMEGLWRKDSHKALYVGNSSNLKLTWSSGLVSEYARDGAHWSKMMGMETQLRELFGNRYINHRQLLIDAVAGDAKPNPFFPGLTEDEAAQQQGLIPFQFHRDIGAGSFAAIVALQADMTAARYQGSRTDAPVSAGSATGEYWLRSDSPGTIHAWNGSAWVTGVVDGTHLNNAGWDVYANEVVRLMGVFGWV